MITTSLTYGKEITSIQEDLKTGLHNIITYKISNLISNISDLECFSMRISKDKLTKTIKKIKSSGFKIEIDENYGFDWEVKIYCNKIY